MLAVAGVALAHLQPLILDPAAALGFCFARASGPPQKVLLSGLPLAGHAGALLRRFAWSLKGLCCASGAQHIELLALVLFACAD